MSDFIVVYLLTWFYSKELALAPSPFRSENVTAPTEFSSSL